MNKKIIVAIFIFLAIAVISLGIYFFSVDKADNINIIDRSKDDNKTALPKVKKLNCEDIAGVEEKAGCRAGVAKLLNSEDNSACESLISDADKKTCRESYIIKEAADSGDLNKCDDLADKSLAADCSAQASFSLAIRKRDKKYCENIINKTDKVGCFKALADMGIK